MHQMFDRRAAFSGPQPPRARCVCSTLQALQLLHHRGCLLRRRKRAPTTGLQPLPPWQALNQLPANYRTARGASPEGTRARFAACNQVGKEDSTLHTISCRKFKEAENRHQSPAVPAQQGRGKGGSNNKGASNPKKGKTPNGNTSRSRGRGLRDPSPLDEQTLELFYATGQGCSRTYYQTELHLADTPEQQRLARQPR